MDKDVMEIIGWALASLVATISISISRQISNCEDFVQLNPWDAGSALLVNIFFLHTFNS